MDSADQKEKKGIFSNIGLRRNPTTPRGNVPTNSGVRKREALPFHNELKLVVAQTEPTDMPSDSKTTPDTEDPCSFAELLQCQGNNKNNKNKQEKQTNTVRFISNLIHIYLK